MKLRVHIYQQFEQPFLGELKSLLEDGIEITTGTELPDPADYQALVSGRVDEAFIRSAGS